MPRPYTAPRSLESQISSSYYHRPSSSSAPPPPSSSSTRVPCRFFNTEEGCKRSNCRFLHILIPIPSTSSATPRRATSGIIITRPASATARTNTGTGTGTTSTGTRTSTNTAIPNPDTLSTPSPCKWFLSGACRFGSKCWFSHDPIHLSSSSRSGLSQADSTSTEKPNPPPSSSSSSSSSHQQQSNAPTASTSSLTSDPSHTCGICMEKPDTYGLLQHCDHVFCLPCIQKWRCRTSKDDDLATSNALKTCPLCRSRSHFITPSSVHLTGTSKSTAISQYLARLSKIPCRYFESSKLSRSGPFCPLADDCHFSHSYIPNQPRFQFGYGAEELASQRVLPPTSLDEFDRWPDSDSSTTSLRASQRILPFMNLDEFDGWDSDSSTSSYIDIDDLNRHIFLMAYHDF